MLMFDQGLRNETIHSSFRECIFATLSVVGSFRSVNDASHVSNVPQSRGWERKIAEGPPCVVLASPGFMQVGPSRELLELWAPDSRNGLIITGYSIEGTMARVSAYCSSWGARHVACVFLYVRHITKNTKLHSQHSKPSPCGF